ncbi:MAG: DUF1015 domain-containing protein [Bacteroidia bacterium]
MSTIKPFCAIRPAADKVESVVSHAVERYSHAAIEHILNTNPFSFLQIIYAAKFHKEKYHEQLHAIKNKFVEFRKQRIFEQDSQPCFYVYRQIKGWRSHIGLIALASVEEYKNGTIKIHELTLSEREKKLKEYLTICDFNAEPVCLTHPSNKGLHDFLYHKTNSSPLYDFHCDNVQHSVWKVSDTDELKKLIQLFDSVPALYIADGHHRAASSALLAEEKKRNNPAHTGNEPYNFFLAAIFADTELTIFNFDRMITSLNGHTKESLLSEIEKNFIITYYWKKVCKPSKAGEIGLYIDKHWYLLKIKTGLNKGADPVNSLDVSVLSNFILNPVLNITDLRNDKRIAFIPGVKDTEEIIRNVDSGKMEAAFCLYPVSFKELKAVADTGKEMPPKSTWIEPKFESGLLIYSLSN